MFGASVTHAEKLSVLLGESCHGAPLMLMCTCANKQSTNP